jgi:glycosyltransferase involved in cell wall biosynthesis
MISIIVPAFNESEGIRTLHQRVTACASDWDEPYEVLLIDDGSRDNTLDIAAELAAGDPHLKIISLSRNFGHQPAVTAGLEHARGDVVAIIDADLQDPPEELHRFFAKCREGYDVIYGVRTRRKEGVFKRASYFVFYRVLSQLANIEIPLDSGDFCVLSRRAVDAMNALPERRRFVRGLRSWVGFRQFGLTYERHARLTGEPKYTFAKLVNLALDGIINFSSKPLRLIALLGLGLGAASIFAALFVLTQYVTDWTVWGYNPRASQGWTSTILAILFLHSVTLFSLGIIGEYMGRMFEEIKQRPVYMIDKTVNLDRPPLPPGEAEERGYSFCETTEVPAKG